MKIVLGAVAVVALYAAGQAVFPTHGTVASPNAYWLALALAMTAVAGGTYLRAKFAGRAAPAATAA